MINRRTTFLTFAAALFMFALPVIAAAQGGYGGYGRDPYYGNQRNDNYYRSNVRDAIRRVASRSDEFKDRLDSALDNSRYNGSRREDNLVNAAEEFSNVAGRLKSRYNNGRNNSNAAAEADRLLQLAARIDNFISRNNVNSRISSEWFGLRQDLNVIANAFNLRGGSYNDGYYNDGYRNNDDYNRRNRRNNRRGSYNPYGY